MVVHLGKQSQAIHDGDMTQAENMLAAQAVTLNVIFNELACWAQRSDRVSHISEFLRLALKAQSQARTTIEALSAIKNPPIRQTNIAHGHQQVNNGTSASGKTEKAPTKQSGPDHELLPDSRASSDEIRINPAMEAVGAEHRTEERRG